MYYAKIYAISMITFLVVDLLWIGVIANGFYRKHLDFILADKPNWPAAFAFYFLFVLGIMVFVVVPGLKEPDLKLTLIKAAFFGLVTYATYDLTNLATAKNWPPIVTAVDMVWGTALSTVVSFIGLKAGQWLA